MPKLTKKQKRTIETATSLFKKLREEMNMEYFPIEVDFVKMKDDDVNAVSRLYSSGAIVISFNKKYISKAQFKDIERTAAHELAHCYTMAQSDYYKEYLAAKNKEAYMHNSKWKKALESIGYDPSYYNTGE